MSDRCCYLVLHRVTSDVVPVLVRGAQYFSATETVKVVGVSRQSLWRWRRAGLVSKGRRYRGREVLYTRGEVEAIYAYAHRLEPEDAAVYLADQLNLFSPPDPVRSSVGSSSE